MVDAGWLGLNIESCSDLSPAPPESFPRRIPIAASAISYFDSPAAVWGVFFLRDPRLRDRLSR
jgi:hypothetical protein